MTQEPAPEDHALARYPESRPQDGGLPPGRGDGFACGESAARSALVQMLHPAGVRCRARLRNCVSPPDGCVQRAGFPLAQMRAPLLRGIVLALVRISWALLPPPLLRGIALALVRISWALLRPPSAARDRLGAGANILGAAAPLSAARDRPPSCAPVLRQRSPVSLRHLPCGGWRAFPLPRLPPSPMSPLPSCPFESPSP